MEVELVKNLFRKIKIYNKKSRGEKNCTVHY